MPKVTVEGKNKEFELSEGEIIHHGLDEQGLTLPHGCLSGTCGACLIEITQGAENLSEIGPVEEDTLQHIYEELKRKNGEDYIAGKELRLSCRTRVLGDIRIKVI